MIPPLSWPKLFFYSVVALYVFLILRWAVRSVRRFFERRSAAHYEREQLIPRKPVTPYRKPLFNIDALVAAIDSKITEMNALSEEDQPLSSLWAKSIHQPRKRTRLSDVRQPADPRHRPLEPKPEP